MMWRRYIRTYLDGKGAVVPGACVISPRPSRMAPALPVTALIRASFATAKTGKG